MEAKLPPQAFYVPANRVIFEQCCELYGDGKKPNAEMVAEELKTAKLFESVGGWPYLLEVSKAIATTAQIGYFIDKVKELYLLRELIKFGSGAVEQCFGYQGGLEEFLSSVEHDFMRVMTRSRSTSVSWTSAVTQTEQKLAALLSRPPHTIAPDELTWGFSDMDYHFQPLVKQSVVVLAARPSVGKSSLARAIAKSVAKSGHYVQFHSLEVPASAVVASMANEMSGVSRTTLRRQPSPKDIEAYSKALAELKTITTLHVDDQTDATSLTIMAKARAAAVRKPVSLVIVDYLQLLSDWQASRIQSLSSAGGAVMRNFKELARELNCVVLLLCQLSRLPIKEHNRRPTKADLRDSGDIEAAADVVVLLHRPSNDPSVPNQPPQVETDLVENVPSWYIEVLQDKGRDVGTSNVALRFERAVARFRQTVKNITEPPRPSQPPTQPDGEPFG